jgi:hypothetical protein
MKIKHDNGFDYEDVSDPMDDYRGRKPYVPLITILFIFAVMIAAGTFLFVLLIDKLL